MSTRIEQIDGEFHGIHFQVKPTPIAIRKIENEVADMMREWYKKHHPDVLDKYYTEKDIRSASPEQLKEIADYFEKQYVWMEDVEFRARYCRTMAEAAMAFDKPVPDDVWESDGLEFSTIQEAWGFFCGRRTPPRSGRS